MTLRAESWMQRPGQQGLLRLRGRDYCPSELKGWGCHTCRPRGQSIDPNRIILWPWSNGICPAGFWTWLRPMTSFFLPTSSFCCRNVYPMMVLPFYFGVLIGRGERQTGKIAIWWQRQRLEYSIEQAKELPTKTKS